MTPAPANDNRPASFDDSIMAYRPGMSNLARKLGCRGEERNDLVTDTIVYCLENWQNFHGDTSKMWNWIYWQMRGVISNKRDKRKLEVVDSQFHYDSATTPPSQLDYAELSDTLRRMAGREGDVLMRRAMGFKLREVGKQMGISTERVRQIEEQARAGLEAVQ